MSTSLPAVVLRPFEGLPHEADWVSLREIVPAATATVRTVPQYGGRDVTIVTSLPQSWAAVHREDGQVLVALQLLGSPVDISRTVAAALVAAVNAEPGTTIEDAVTDPEGPRLQDVLDPEVPLEPTVHQGFEFWVDANAVRTPEIEEALSEAADSLIPTEKLTSVPSAYWSKFGAREFLRWAFAVDEERLLDGIARLHEKRESSVAGGKFVGAFRAAGISIPVWELPRGTAAADIEADVAAFLPGLEAAIADDSELTFGQRRARAGIVARQVTLR